MRHRLHLLARFIALAGRRFVEDDCLNLAASLTYTTLLALVPLITIALTMIAAFPAFKEFTQGLDQFFAQQMLPPSVARTVARYVDEFTRSAARLTTVGIAFLAVTAIMLMHTIERAVNGIWRVRRARPLVFRVLTYWGVLTLGPLLIGVSLTMTSYLVSVSLGLAKQIPGGAAVLLGFIPLLFTAIAFTLIYYVLPNRPVQFRHAVTGGIVAAMMFELMKRGFAFYVAKFPTYTLVYGAFAAVPIFLIWLYLSWVVALLGAVITALLPNIRIWREEVDPSASGPFHDALNLLRVLVRAQRVARTPSTRELCMEAYVPHDAAERLLEQMHAAGWVARVVGDRWALACDPDTVRIADVYSWLVLAPAVGKGGQRNAVIDGLIDRAVASANHSLAAPIRMLATESIVGNIAKLESPDAANAARMGAKPS